MPTGIYGIKDAANIILKKKSDNTIALRADYATVSNVEWTADQVYAMSKSTRAIRWDFNRQATVKMTMEVFDLTWLSVLSGSEFVTGSTEIMTAEYLTTNGLSQVTLQATPVSGSVIAYLVAADEITYNQADKQIEGSSTNEGEFSLSGTQVTFNSTSVPSSTQVVVFYLKNTAVTSKKLTIAAESFPVNYEMWMDTYIRPKGGAADEFVQWHYFDVKPMTNFTVTMSASEITKLEVTFDVFKNSDTNMAEFIIV